MNLKKGLALERLFITAKFRKRSDGLPGAILPGGEPSPQPLPSESSHSSCWGAADTEGRARAAPSDLSQGPHRPTAALPSAAPARPEACSVSEAAAPGGAPGGAAGGAAASGAEADRDACAWSEAKLRVHQCLRDALGPDASAAQRSQLLDEVRDELRAAGTEQREAGAAAPPRPTACLDTQDLAAAASSLSVGGKHQIC